MFYVITVIVCTWVYQRQRSRSLIHSISETPGEEPPRGDGYLCSSLLPRVPQGQSLSCPVISSPRSFHPTRATVIPWFVLVSHRTFSSRVTGPHALLQLSHWYKLCASLPLGRIQMNPMAHIQNTGTHIYTSAPHLYTCTCVHVYIAHTKYTKILGMQNRAHRMHTCSALHTCNTLHT